MNSTSGRFRLSVLLAAILMVGCPDSGSAGDDVCVPGATQPCTGPAACAGGQSCLLDGSAWGECLCAAPSPSDAGTDAGSSLDAGMDAGSSPMDECINLADQAVLMTDGGDASSIAEECAITTCLSVLATEDRDTASACVHDCMDLSSVSALSADCASCYVNSALCKALECAGDCFTGPSPGCDGCFAMNCAVEMEVCAGFMVP